MAHHSALLLSTILLGIVICGAQPPPATGTSTSPCATVRCGYYAMCQVVNGSAECICSTVCLAVVDPVCGSDNKTYSNLCVMQSESCRLQKSVSLLHKGACKAQPSVSCEDTKCDYNGACYIDNGVAKCTCPVCGAIYSPVCASDGKTYDNDCAVMTESCRQQKAITVIKDRACDARSKAARIAIPTAFAFLVVIGFAVVAVVMYLKMRRKRRRAAKIHKFTTFENEEQKSGLPT